MRALLEGLEHRVLVAVVVHADLVEIVETALARDVLRPIVRIALEHDDLARPDAVDAVGTRCDQRLQRRLVEIRSVGRMLRQDRQQRQQQRQFAIGLVVEGQPHAVLADLLHLGDDVDPALVERPPLVAQQLQRKDHVVLGDRRAVGEFGARVERELDIGAVGVGVDRLGDQRIERESFIARARHQRLEDIVAEGSVEQAARGVALDDEGVQAVERSLPGIVDPPALGCIGIGVGEMREIGRQRRVAMHGDRVRRGAECQRLHEQQGRNRGEAC